MKKIIKKILPNNLVNLIGKYRSLNRLNINKSHIKNISYTSKSNILSELCEKYGSDKGFINFNIDKKPYNWDPHTYATH